MSTTSQTSASTSTTTESNPSGPTTPPSGYSHKFHAEAHVLSGKLRAPINQEIERHAPVALHDERGGHLTRFIEDASIEGLIHFKTGHTRVSGSPSVKHEAWVTLSTSVLEGLNVFEIITADRVVSQVSTEHPYKDGHVPKVTFLGTKFENLRICGFPVELTLDLEACGDKPDKDRSYLTKLNFLTETRARVASIHDSGYLPSKVRTEYHTRLSALDDLIRKCNTGVDVTDEAAKVTCSLVKKIVVKHDDQIPGLRTIGNVLVIKDFGAVSFAEVEVGTEKPNLSNGFKRSVLASSQSGSAKSPSRMSNYFEVTMLNMELGCVGDGTVKAAQSKTNGQTTP
jgi:hypothetical protein